MAQFGENGEGEIFPLFQLTETKVLLNETEWCEISGRTKKKASHGLLLTCGTPRHKIEGWLIAQMGLERDWINSGRVSPQPFMESKDGYLLPPPSLAVQP